MPLVTLALIALMLLFVIIAPEPSPAFSALVLDRTEPRMWTWVSAHALHTDWQHFAWNAFAVGCLGLLAEPLCRSRFVTSILVGVAAVDVWFATVDTSLRFYCGASGALNAVLLATLYALRRTVATPWLVGVAAIAATKVSWEWHTGAALFTHARWPAAVGAHVAGFLGGLALVGVLAWRDRPQRL